MNHQHEFHRNNARDEYLCHCGEAITGAQLDAVRLLGWQPLTREEAALVAKHRAEQK